MTGARVAFTHVAACATVTCRRTDNESSIHRASRGHVQMSQRLQLRGHLR